MCDRWIKILNFQQLLDMLEVRNQIDGVVILNHGGRSSKTFFKNEKGYSMFNYIDGTEETLTEDRVSDYIWAGALYLEGEL